MVRLFLDGFGGDRRRQKASHLPSRGIDCYHVNARLSKQLEDIGDLRAGKLLLLFGYCLQAIWVRLRHGVENFYYVPAPGKRSALYRDWLVMFLCRPFFKRVILHWHAAGLAKWLETERQMRSRVLTYRLMKQVDLSIVLSRYNQADAEKLLPRRVSVIGNGIPDPCPQYERDVMPRQRARAAARRKLLAGERLTSQELTATNGDPHLFRVLFLAHCTREKGMFDTLDSVALVNAQLARDHSPLRVHLTVAGAFLNPKEQEEFEQRITKPDLQIAAEPREPGGAPTRCCVTYTGFVAGEEKRRVFAESDCFCFPTYYYAESFGLVVLEAMAFGLPIIASRWRSIPELMPADFPGMVPPRTPQKVAEAMLQILSGRSTTPLRDHFLQHFSLEQYLNNLASAFRTLEDDEGLANTPAGAPAVAG